MYKTAFLSFLCLSAYSLSAAAVQYQFTDLGTLGVPNNTIAGTWPHAINDAGQITGRGATTSTTDMGFIWQSGSMTGLGSLGGGTSEGFGINDQGQIVGTSSPAHTTPGAAFLWTNGQMQALQATSPSYGGSVARAISNNGPNGLFIAGFVANSVQSTSAALWKNGSLTVISGMQIGFGVNDIGQVVGEETASSDSRAVLYQNGTTSDLFAGEAFAINDSGEIVGDHIDPNSLLSYPCIYANGLVTNIGPEGNINEALAINDQGVVVGRYQPSFMVDHAFIWQNNTFYDLNNIASAGTGATFISAEGINDAGQITGLYSDSHGNLSGYLLTPLPEPNSLVLLAAALPTLFRYRRTKRTTHRTTDRSVN